PGTSLSLTNHPRDRQNPRAIFDTTRLVHPAYDAKMQGVRMLLIHRCAAGTVRVLLAGLLITTIPATAAVAGQTPANTGSQAPAPPSDAPPPRLYEEVVVTASARDERLG